MVQGTYPFYYRGGTSDPAEPIQKAIRTIYDTEYKSSIIAPIYMMLFSFGFMLGLVITGLVAVVKLKSNGDIEYSKKVKESSKQQQNDLP